MEKQDAAYPPPPGAFTYNTPGAGGQSSTQPLPPAYTQTTPYPQVVSQPQPSEFTNTNQLAAMCSACVCSSATIVDDRGRARVDLHHQDEPGLRPGLHDLSALQGVRHHYRVAQCRSDRVDCGRNSVPRRVALI